MTIPEVTEITELDGMTTELHSIASNSRMVKKDGFTLDQQALNGRNSYAVKSRTPRVDIFNQVIRKEELPTIDDDSDESRRSGDSQLLEFNE